MRVLITGASGQLGRCLQDCLSTSENQIFAFTRKELDITNYENVLDVVARVHPDIIINTAAYTAVDKAEKDIEKAYLVNETGPENIAKVALQFDAALIHISTDYVFDGFATSPYDENAQTNPLGIYGKSKLAGELAVKANCKKYLILRTSWVFSEYGNNFLKSMLRLGNQHDKLTVVNDQFGSPTYAGDIAETIIQLMPMVLADTEFPKTFHYSGDETTTWYRFAEEIFKHAKHNSLVNTDLKAMPISSEEYPVLAPRPMYSVLDCQRIDALGNIQLSNWKAAIVRIVSKFNSLVV